MFLIWFLVAGVIVGLLRKGRVTQLERLPLRAPWLVVVAMVVQALIFPWGDRDPVIKVGTNYLHVVSYLPLLIFVYLNRGYKELILIGIGILCNLVVILANGGFMPVSPFALRQAGHADFAEYLEEVHTSGNVILMGDNTRLNFLGDILFLPPWMPFATAFSIGDLLLGAGLLAFLAAKGEVQKSGEAQGRLCLALLEKLARADTVSQIAEVALQHAVDVIPGATSGSFLLWDEEEGVFKFVAAVGCDLDELRRLCFKLEELLQSELGDSEEPCLIKDPGSLLQQYLPQQQGQIKGSCFSSKELVSVPIRYGEKVIGYLNIGSETAGVFGEKALDVIKDFQKAVEFSLVLHFNREELVESERRLRLLFEEAPDAIYITDYQTNILDCNKAATEQTGYTKEELLRMKIVPDLAVDPPPVDLINERLERGERVIFEEKKRRKDGKLFYTEVALAPITYRGRRAALSFNRDITWRKQHEEKVFQLWKLSKDLLNSRREEEVAEKAVSFCLDLFEPTYCGVYFYREGAYRLIASYRPTEMAICLPDTFSSIAELAKNGPPKTHLIITPITFGEKRMGYFVVATEEEVSEYHRRLMELLSLQIANVLQVAEYTGRLEEFANRLEKLHRVATKFHQIGNEKEMCAVAVELLENILGFDYCSIDLREGGYLVPMCHSTKMRHVKPRPFRIDEGISGRTYQEQRTFWGEDVRELPYAKPVSPEIRAYISVPIGDYGVIQIISKKVGAFSVEDVKLVEILAQQMYEGLKRIRLEREIREQAVRDPLTGLYNRRYFDIFIELYRKRPEGGVLGLSILDMDGFKDVNDRFGHTVGDEVLVAVAQLLRKNVRSDDVVIRWGGDEFLILMPKTEAEEARKVVERLRKVVMVWTHPRYPEIRLGFTAGVSTWDPQEGGEVDEALRAADEELYAQKGRRKGNRRLREPKNGGE